MTVQACATRLSLFILNFFFGFMPLKLYQLIGCFEILYLTRG